MICGWECLIQLLLDVVSARWHNKALLVSFDTERESEHHVDVLTQDIKQILSRLDKGIKQIVMHYSGDQVVVQVRDQGAISLYFAEPDGRRCRNSKAL